MLSDLWRKPRSPVDLTFYEKELELQTEPSYFEDVSFLDHLHFSYWNNMQGAEYRSP